MKYEKENGGQMISVFVIAFHKFNSKEESQIHIQKITSVLSFQRKKLF